uniref:Uncharacterized protein n=1 Tax=Oncorhynchus kisutch TaxID=8019 RepID=A0A8C7HFU4_ONCKI
RSSLSLHLRPLPSKKPADEDDEEFSQPIKFSSSKASHKTWNVDQSLGSKYQRPWWKVLPISLLGVSFLLWCALRGETFILDIQWQVPLPSLCRMTCTLSKSE